jgi:hypothetical protein
MIVQYNGKTYRGYDAGSGHISIVTNHREDGFSEYKQPKGETMYRRVINTQDAEGVYDLSFKAVYKGMQFTCTYYEGLMNLHDNGRTGAIERGFTEIDRAIWLKKIPLYEADLIIEDKYNYKTGQHILREITVDDFVSLTNYIHEVERWCT